ncbi:MAG TPA: tRNA-dihydrouridine synthase family protein [Draconibacterium sp.]|nr:tRNA-dihydrouridine synthase family protein [Draconibacterium sp.]
MPASVNQSTRLIYLAPLQGFTDFIYRKAFNEILEGVDAFFIPYISVKNNEVLKKYEKEILPENNPQDRVIPQVLTNNRDELLFLSKFLEDKGYREINLNLGCPYPMVTNREMGAGLLPHPDKLHQILSPFFENSDLGLSVKLRTGLVSPFEIEQITTVLNQFPLTEVIFHPRIAKQLYEGEIIDSAFEFAKTNLKHRLVYNGDIFSPAAFDERSQKFSEINCWMLGRGVLMNPFLPAEIKGINFSKDEKFLRLETFHKRVFELYAEKMDNDGNVLNKMKQFWIYFSYNFEKQAKSFKLIKKTNSLAQYKSAVKVIFGRTF